MLLHTCVEYLSGFRFPADVPYKVFYITWTGKSSGQTHEHCLCKKHDDSVSNQGSEYSHVMQKSPYNHYNSPASQESSKTKSS